VHIDSIAEKLEILLTSRVAQNLTYCFCLKVGFYADESNKLIVLLSGVC